MILLDTDHLSILAMHESARRAELAQRITESDDPFVLIPVISIEEQCRGWLAEINRMRSLSDEVRAHERFSRFFSFFCDWQIAPFDPRAAAEYLRLRKKRIRIGTQDLKIASIALVNDALLLSANLRDFQRVPGLRVEDWLR